MSQRHGNHRDQNGYVDCTYLAELGCYFTVSYDQHSCVEHRFRKASVLMVHELGFS